MITTILSDFSRVILNPKDRNYKGTLNGLFKELKEKNTPFHFFDYFQFNDEVLGLYTQLKPKYSLNIFTSGSIQNTIEVRKKLNGIFENIFSAEEFGLDKKNPEAYQFIATKLEKLPNEILFIDDQQENINAATITGMKTLLYYDFSSLRQKFPSYLK